METCFTGATRWTQKIPDVPDEERTPLVTALLEIVQIQQELIQELKDEIARLKDQKPKPRIKPSVLGKDSGNKGNTVTLAVVASNPDRFPHPRWLARANQVMVGQPLSDIIYGKHLSLVCLDSAGCSDQREAHRQRYFLGRCASLRSAYPTQLLDLIYETQHSTCCLSTDSFARSPGLGHGLFQGPALMRKSAVIQLCYRVMFHRQLFL